LKLSGFIAWLLWRLIYLMKMSDFDRKLRVSTDWLLDLLLPQDIVQLKIERSASFGREHFEPQEIIFRQGDRGDRLYFIIDGEVEIAKQDPGVANRSWGGWDQGLLRRDVLGERQPAYGHLAHCHAGEADEPGSGCF